MAEEKVEVSSDGLSRLQSAALDFARAEIDRIVHAVIGALRTRPTEGVFGDVHARHSWDEYCWALQEGPFDDPTIIVDTNFGSLSDAFEDLLQGTILAEVEKLPKHAQTFLSAIAFAEDPDSDQDECLGCMWIDGIVKVVTEAVNERASRRNLDLIGPNRADAVGYEIQGDGFIWSMLDSSAAMDLVRAHVDAMIDPNGDLSLLADEMVEAFLMTADEDADDHFFRQLVAHFGAQVRSMIEADVLTSLGTMRRKLLEGWDG